MTKKKTTPSTKPTSKKKPASAKSSTPKAAKTSKEKVSKANNANPRSKGGGSKALKTTSSSSTAVKGRGRKTKTDTSKTSQAKSVKRTTVGESKVKEIASKTKVKLVEEKKETKGFSLADVRAILKSKSPTQSKKSGGIKDSSENKVPSKKSASKRKIAKVKKIQTASINDILGFGVPSLSARPIRDEKKVPKELLPYYKNLMELRLSLKGALGERSQDTLGASARELSGELSLNSSDAGSDTFNRDVALSMVANEQEALEEIEDAIDRIFDGTFGICQETQKPIKKARLKVVPFTRFSLEGQTQFEQRKKKDNDSGTGAFATISDSTLGQDD